MFIRRNRQAPQSFASDQQVNYRKATADDAALVRSAIASPEWADADVKPILIVEGWLSTDGLARDGFIIPATAWSIADFLKNPALRFMHETPVGVFTEIEKRATGLYGKAAIFDTVVGRDAALLVSAGVLRNFSVGFNVPAGGIQWGQGDAPSIITAAELVEGSLVDAAADVDASIESIGRLAKQRGIELNPLTLGASARRSRSTMTPEEIARLKQVEADAKLAREASDAMKVTVADVKREKDDLATKLVNAQRELETTKGTAAEQTRVIQAMADDIKKSQENFDKKIEEVRASRTVTRESAVLADMSVAEIMSLSEGDMKRYLTASESEKVRVMQSLNDEACLLAALAVPGERSSQGARSAYAKETKAYKRLVKMARAMDIATASEGLEWVPAPFSSQFIRDFRLPNPLAGLFPTIRFNSKSLTIPVEGAAQVATYVAETQTVIAAFVSGEQTPVTGNLTLTPKKYKGRTQVSREITEDSIVAILPYVSSSVQASIDLAWEYALLTSQASGTHMDTNITASTDARKSINGLRYYADSIRSTDGVDGSSFSVASIQNCRAKMGKYGINPADLVLIASLKGYLTRLLNKTEMSEVFTIDKYGANAVVVTGELAKVLGISAVVSGVYPDNLNAIGRYDGSVTSQTSMLIANRKMFLQGIRRDIEVFTEFDSMNDVYQLVAYARMDFQPVLTPTTATAVTVNSIYNVNTGS